MVRDDQTWMTPHINCSIPFGIKRQLQGEIERITAIGDPDKLKQRIQDLSEQLQYTEKQLVISTSGLLRSKNELSLKEKEGQAMAEK